MYISDWLSACARSVTYLWCSLGFDIRCDTASRCSLYTSFMHCVFTNCKKWKKIIYHSYHEVHAFRLQISLETKSLLTCIAKYSLLHPNPLIRFIMHSVLSFPSSCFKLWNHLNNNSQCFLISCLAVSQNVIHVLQNNCMKLHGYGFTNKTNFKKDKIITLP